MKKLFLFMLCFYATITAAAKNGDGANTVKANLTAVTVYRTGAEMNHLAKADLVKGNNELLIENISNSIDVNSLQVNCSGNITVMGVEFSTDYLQNETKSAVVKLLEDSLEKLNAFIENNKTGINITNELLSVLKSNKEIKGTQTGLSVAELMKLMEYYKTKSIELQSELSALNQKNNRFAEQVAKLKVQIEEEQKKNTKSFGRIILQLNCAVEGKYDFNISYVTQNAYWTPFYDLRADNIKTPLKLVYRAKIFQTTGIDWKQVKLSLSTSSPTQTSNAPIFKTWFLGYVNSVKYYNNALATSNTIPSVSSNDMKGKVAGQLNEMVATARGTRSLETAESPLYVVNGTEMPASEYQKLNTSSIKKIEVIKAEDAEGIYGSRAQNGVIVVTLKDGLDDYISIADKELNIVFDIDLPYDVPTNGKAQTALLKEYEVPAAYKFYAVPKLDKDVFLLAEIVDWGKLNLLPGEANIIFEGTYIGKSFIDPSSTQDTLNLTMGRDKRVVVKREKLVDFSSIKFLGANKKQVFTYEITVKNNKKDTIDILVKDQYPISQNKEVEVELLEKSAASDNEEIGVLTWKLKLSPGEVKRLRVSYSIKYPKDKVLNL